jgi:hypothetical protein
MLSPVLSELSKKLEGKIQVSGYKLICLFLFHTAHASIHNLNSSDLKEYNCFCPLMRCSHSQVVKIDTDKYGSVASQFNVTVSALRPNQHVMGLNQRNVDCVCSMGAFARSIRLFVCNCLFEASKDIGTRLLDDDWCSTMLCQRTMYF